MANSALLASALFCGAFHIWVLTVSQINTSTKTWTCAVIGGILTSIWNHASTSELARWLDRCTIAVGVCLDVYILSSATPNQMSRESVLALGGCRTALLAALGLYFTAKSFEHTCWKRRDACHVGAHVLATILHVCMATLLVVPVAE